MPRLLHSLHMLGGQNPGMFSSDPVEQFIEHCWAAPFVEDSVDDLARHLPVERILFGSDWPHAEACDFFANVASFSLDDKRKDPGRERTVSHLRLSADPSLCGPGP